MKFGDYFKLLDVLMSEFSDYVCLINNQVGPVNQIVKMTFGFLKFSIIPELRFSGGGTPSTGTGC